MMAWKSYHFLFHILLNHKVAVKNDVRRIIRVANEYQYAVDESVVNIMIDKYADEEILEQITSIRVHPDSSVYVRLINLLKKGNDLLKPSRFEDLITKSSGLTQAIEIFKILVIYGVEPSQGIYDAIIGKCSTNDEAKLIFEILKDSTKVNPSVGSLKKLIKDDAT